jgi:hypothetical protein
MSLRAFEFLRPDKAQGRSSDSTRRVGVLAHHLPLPAISAQRWAGTPTLLLLSAVTCSIGGVPIHAPRGDSWGHSGTFWDIWGRTKQHILATHPSWCSKNALGTRPWVQNVPRWGVVWGHLGTSCTQEQQRDLPDRLLCPNSQWAEFFGWRYRAAEDLRTGAVRMP